MAGIVKTTTGLTGMAVARDPHKNLKVIYEKLLSVIQKMPENAAYRKHTQVLIQDRLEVVKAEPNVQKVEEKINNGQIEEIVIQAERELSLARRMLEWRAWEPLVQQAPPNQWKWPI